MSMPAERMSPDTVSDKVFAAYFHRVGTEVKFDPTQFRLSESGHCPRHRVAKVLGLAIDDQEQDVEIYERGHIVGDWGAQRLREEYKGGLVRREVEVKIPHLNASGHIDAIVYSIPRPFEFKSVSDFVRAEELPKPEWLRQCQAYLHFKTDKRGQRMFQWIELVPVRVGMRFQPLPPYLVRYNPTIGREIENELVSLNEYAEKAILPDIPEGMTADSFPCSFKIRGGMDTRFCSGYHLCWKDNPHLGVEAAMLPDIEPLLLEWELLRDSRRGQEKAADECKSRMLEIERELRMMCEAMGINRLETSSFIMQRSPVVGRVTYDIQAAILSGIVTAEDLEPFRKVGQGYDRWNLKRKDV